MPILHQINDQYIYDAIDAIDATIDATIDGIRSGTRGEHIMTEQFQMTLSSPIALKRAKEYMNNQLDDYFAGRRDL